MTDHISGRLNRQIVGSADTPHDAHKIAYAAILDGIGRQLNAGHTRQSANLPSALVFDLTQCFRVDMRYAYGQYVGNALWYGGYNAAISLVVDGELRDAVDAIWDATRHYDDTTRTYISDCPITSYLRAIWHDKTDPDPTRVDGGHIGQCLRWESETLRLSWYPTDKPVTTETPYQSSNRHAAKLVRAIKTLYPAIVATDKQWSQFNDRMIARLNPSTNIEIVFGDDIPETYDMRHHDHIGSCMAGNGRYMDLYASNPKQIRMIRVVSDNDVLMGRALLWRQDDGCHYLDRIYAADPRVEQQIKDYARDNVSDLTTYPGVVSLQYHDFSEYPYLDTFCYLDMETGSLSSCYPGGWYRTLRSTDGDYDESGRETRVTITFTVSDSDTDDLAYDIRRHLTNTYAVYDIVIDAEPIY